jgi:Leucine-rich repeat (LRR) protein
MTISPRTFDNIIAKLTGLTSLSVTLHAGVSLDASLALEKLVNLRQLQVRSLSVTTQYSHLDSTRPHSRIVSSVERHCLGLRSMNIDHMKTP